MKNKHLKEFQKIPGVGPSIAQDLWNMTALGHKKAPYSFYLK
ncbi:MAG: hypothetical protein KR126chlam2_00223 [Chlamydiae bacterium]|nr:hypothetical protein [Chlamydiota bacterium]